LPSRDLGLTDDSATAAVHVWRTRGITAVAAYNDDVAAAVVGAAFRIGLDVPGDR
jgi:DNA-binding LacI/PurR family transcriptional regulator